MFMKNSIFPASNNIIFKIIWLINLNKFSVQIKNLKKKENWRLQHVFAYVEVSKKMSISVFQTNNIYSQTV